MAHDSLREVGTAHGLSRGRPIADRLFVDLKAEFPERLHHRRRSTLPVGAVARQPFAQNGIEVLDQVSEDVEVPAGDVECGYLDACDDPDTKRSGGVNGLP